MNLGLGLGLQSNKPYAIYNQDLSLLLPSIAFDLDATIAASYGGSGETWANLASVPGEGSAKTAYDMNRGTSSGSEGSDPTFTGSAGDYGAYWSMDGGDQFSLASGANTAFLRDLGKTTGGSDFYFGMALRMPADDSAVDTLFSAETSTASIGWRIQQTTGETLQMVQRGDTNVSSVNPTPTIPPSTDKLLIVSHSHSLNTTRFWIDGTNAIEIAQTFNATTTNASALFKIGVLGASTNPVANGTRIYAAFGGNAYLDNSQSSVIRAVMRTRHRRSYS
jgi:hypothetical protein